MTHHANVPGSDDGEECDKFFVYVAVVLIASVSMREPVVPRNPRSWGLARIKPVAPCFRSSPAASEPTQ